MLNKPNDEETQESLTSSIGLRFSKVQRLASLFLLVALVALGAKVFQLTTKPEATLRSIADSDDAIGNAFFTQRETLVLAINFERWMSGNETKRAVLIRRSLLGQRLNVKDTLGVTNAERASSTYLQALEEVDSCLAKEAEGVLSVARQESVREDCGGSLEVLTFEARQLGVEISNAGDVRLREIIRRDRENRDTQIIQLLSIVALLLAVGGFLGISRARALQGVRRVVESDQNKLSEARDSLSLLEAEINARIEADTIQRIEDQRLDRELRSIVANLRKAPSSAIAIEVFADGLHRLINSEFIYVQFFAGAEERDLAYSIHGDIATAVDFEHLGIDRDFKSEILIASQKIWNETDAGRTFISELRKCVPAKVLIEFDKLGFSEDSDFMPIGEGQIVLGYVVFRKRSTSVFQQSQFAAVKNAVAQAANSVGAIRSTALVQRIRENEQVVAELRALDKLKDDFTANVNHELRTPLTSIIGYLELVLSDSQNLPDAAINYLSTVKRNADRLAELIERLLVVAKSDNELADFAHGEVDLAAVVRSAVQAVSQKDPTKSIDIKTEVDNFDFRMIGDKLRLEQVVINLVSNAVKFSKGYSTVSVSLRHLQGKQNSDAEAELIIEDSGIGIPANEIPELFNRFFRASNATKALIPGTGLGLSIVKQFVENHRGKISIESVIGRGTTVTVRLPLTRSNLV